jgi:hypothetical protein
VLYGVVNIMMLQEIALADIRRYKYKMVLFFTLDRFYALTLTYISLNFKGIVACFNSI